MVPRSNLPHDSLFAAGRKRILVVEDELLIRLMVSEELREAGFDVIEAFNAEEALAVLNSAVQVDLVFSDVRMPGSLDGLGLLAFVRSTFPALPVIISSGHLASKHGLDSGAAQVLTKPYRLEAVVEAVRDELGRTE